jgi:two-component system, sensor histidine kinase
MKRRDLSIGQRMMAGSAIVALLIVGLGVAMAVSISRINALQREQIAVVAPRAAAAEELKTSLYRQAVAFRNYVITSTPEHLDAFRRSEQEVDWRIERVAVLAAEGNGLSLFEEIGPIVDSHRRAFDEFLTQSRAGADPQTLRNAEANAAEYRGALLEKMQSYAALQAQARDDAAKSIAEAISELRLAVVVVTLLIFTALFVNSFLVGRSVREPAAGLMAAAEAIRGGRYDAAIALQADEGQQRGSFRDELRETAHLFGRMAATLESRESRLESYSRLSAVLGTSLDPREVASHALHEVSAHVGAEIAAVYLTDTSGATLLPLASIALDGEPEVLSVGEGIPGQAAADRATRVVRDIPPDTPFRVRLGFDQVPPRCVVATPMTLKDRVVGVLVFGAVRDLDEDAVGFIEQAAGQLAITLDNSLAHVRIASLASELQDRNETLHGQNEELQAQSEELQAQSEELQSQNEELQAQSEELQSQADELQSQAEELRAQQSALARTNEALARAEEQKNRFLAVLGHELRNPLAAISGAVGLLDGSTDEEARVHQVVRRQTAHLASLLDDLLDVGRITSGKIRITRHALELGAAARHCADLVSSNAGSDAPSIAVEVAEPVWIDGDETRIEQIITNLLTNALKFTPASGTISVRVGAESGEAVLRVSDTGIGIERELLPRVFDFFVQGPGGPNGNGGLGVGLTLVRKLTELHGGSIEAESEGAGHGATFTLRFPATAARAVALAASTAERARLPIKRSVVVVEDNADVRQMIRLWLKKAGHEVAEAHDGPTGVEVVATAKPDVALIDLDLPGFDGCEVARRLRRDPGADAVRLIAVSGYGRPEDRERALDAGFDDHFVKPLDFERLTSVLASIRADE